MGIFSSKEAKLLIVGLDNSGKSTMIARLKPQKVDNGDIAPTVGYNQEQFKKNSINFTVFDMSGQSQYRDMWQKIGKSVEGIVFVIDSADKLRFAMVEHELKTLLEEPEIKNKPIPILFLANKMDINGAATPNDFVEMLHLGEISNRSWHINASNALTGSGIDDGIKWLTDKIHKK